MVSRWIYPRIILIPVLFAFHAEAKMPRSHYAIAEFKQIQPCPANENKHGPCPGWQIDHIKPLKCKGDDAPTNMQWLTVKDHKEKTAREAKLCRKKSHRHYKRMTDRVTNHEGS